MLRKKKTTSRVLRPLQPSVGFGIAYHKRLLTVLEEMQNSLLYWISAQYNKNPPLLAADALPATDMIERMEQLQAQWTKKFDAASTDLASWFAQGAMQRSNIALMKILDEAGMTVDFKFTRPMQDAYRAVVGENVGLIRSLSEKQLADAQGMVMRSVASGRDLATLSKELRETFGVSKRRAALIARDQNNKATAVVNKVRQQELGITRAVWKHSGAGKEPRPSHVAFSRGEDGGPEYEIARGAFIDGKWIYPGEEINCRCTSCSIIPGF